MQYLMHFLLTIQHFEMQYPSSLILVSQYIQYHFAQYAINPDDGNLMVHCEVCKEWYHNDCIPHLTTTVIGFTTFVIRNKQLVVFYRYNVLQ